MAPLPAHLACPRLRLMFFPSFTRMQEIPFSPSPFHPSPLCPNIQVHIFPFQAASSPINTVWFPFSPSFPRTIFFIPLPADGRIFPLPAFLLHKFFPPDLPLKAFTPQHQPFGPAAGDGLLGVGIGRVGGAVGGKVVNVGRDGEGGVAAGGRAVVIARLALPGQAETGGRSLGWSLLVSPSPVKLKQKDDHYVGRYSSCPPRSG